MKTAFQGILIGAAGYLALYGAIHYALDLRSPVPPPTPPSIAVTRPGTARLHLDGGPYDAVDWRVLYATDITAPVKTTVSKDGLDAEAGDRPGKYLAIASVVRGGAISHADAVFEVPGVDPSPPPPPPDPGPAPPAPLITGRFYAIGLFDGNRMLAATPGQRDIYTSILVNKQISDLGGHWYRFDVNQADIADRSWLPAAKAAGIPSLALFDEQCKLVKVLPMPAAGVDAMIAEIKAAKGVK